MLPDEYTKRLIHLFIEDILEGNLDNLVHLNLKSLKDDMLYGYSYGTAFSPSMSRTVRAIMVAAFGDLWPELNLDSIAEYKYTVSPINRTNYIMGANIGDEYFKGLQKFNPSRNYHNRCVKVDRLMYTIGNYWIMPGDVTQDLGTYHYHWLTDLYLQDVYKVMTGDVNANHTLKEKFNNVEQQMARFKGAAGFKKLMQGMFLNDYLYAKGTPKNVLPHVWTMMKPLNLHDYFEAVEHYCLFMEHFIPKRGQMIVDKLKTII